MSWLLVIIQGWAGYSQGRATLFVPHFHPSLTASLPEPTCGLTPCAWNQPFISPSREHAPSEMILFPSPS